MVSAHWEDEYCAGRERIGLQLHDLEHWDANRFRSFEMRLRLGKTLRWSSLPSNQRMQKEGAIVHQAF